MGSVIWSHVMNMQVEPDDRRTAFGRRPSRIAVERDEKGTWHVRSYAGARSLLRGEGSRQAGFKAELVERLPEKGKVPILFLEGKPHHEQRRLTAPFFTPRAVDTRYRALMARLAEEVIGRFRAAGRGELSAMGMAMAVGVAAEVVGLTESRVPGLDRRINAFFAGGLGESGGWVRRAWQALVAQLRLARFYWLDVRPSMAARRVRPREDVISHLLAQGYRGTEILTECITYGAAGMVTTREFITVCAWHLIENARLRDRYLAADEAGRHALLEELLRLEPVVGTLFRRTTCPVAVEGVEIPQGALVAVDVRAVNADPAVSGERPLTAQPGRCPADRAGAPVLSFGDGHHRCPGSFLAIQETEIFLTRLLATPGLRLERPPQVGWNDLVTGYELREAWIACDQPPATTSAGPSVSATV
jgi:cytochrome P450